MSFNKIITFFLLPILCLLFINCTSESTEELYVRNDSAAKIEYNSRLKTIIGNKCISCHDYHLEGTNRYDTFEKTKSAISEMMARIYSTSNTTMPPEDSSELTFEEKLVFEDFYNALNNVETEAFAVTWTAYKYPDFNNRTPVSGTFDDIDYQLNDNYSNPIDILENATVTVNTSSVNVGGNEEKTQNTAYFFSFFSSDIVGVVNSYTEQNALISFTMNGLEQEVEFDVTIEAGKLILNGSVPDMNFFNWQNAYDELATVCGEYHQQKVWEDITVKIEIKL
ncbi:MAG: YceI family protein [Flavobacteriaceae bacterium]|nr:YceI family protein [Flavobacteriaceae bacterium]